MPTVAAVFEAAAAGQKMSDLVLLMDAGEGVQEMSALASLLSAAECQEPEFDAVLVWNFSRLSRDRARFAEIRRTLADRGVRLVSATESTDPVSLTDMLRELSEGTGDVHTG